MEDKIKSIDGHIREARSLVNVMITAAENVYEPDEKMINCLYMLEQKLDIAVNEIFNLTSA